MDPDWHWQDVLSMKILPWGKSRPDSCRWQLGVNFFSYSSAPFDRWHFVSSLSWSIPGYFPDGSKVILSSEAVSPLTRPHWVDPMNPAAFLAEQLSFWTQQPFTIFHFRYTGERVVSPEQCVCRSRENETLAATDEAGLKYLAWFSNVGCVRLAFMLFND